MVFLSKNFTKNDQMDRVFLDVSSKMAEPFCFVWHLLNYRLIAPLDTLKFENDSSKMVEVSKRIAIVFVSIMAALIMAYQPIIMLSSIAALGCFSRFFRYLGFSLQKKGYTHVLGKAKEITLNENLKVSIMNWNICGIGGGLSLDHGGVVDYRLRLDAIVQKIKDENPKILVLQEVYDTALAERLITKLQNDYAHIFLHLGPNFMGSVGGCMVMSKCALHKFSYVSFTNNHWSLNRGFASLEIKKCKDDVGACARLIATHLIHGEDLESQKKRSSQVAQILQFLANQTVALPTIISGDLNIERDSSECSILSQSLNHAYLGSEATCTNYLLAQWKRLQTKFMEETIDYISLFKRIKHNGQDIAVIDKDIKLENCRLIKAYDESYNTKTALSDHHGLFAVLQKD